MKAEELRIGNLFTDIFKDTNVVTELRLQSVYFDVLGKEGDCGGMCTYIAAEPIPLTEEWLLKLGFKKFKNYNDFSRKGIIIHGRKRGFVLRKSVPVIKYVHQLQNLYFALTGEELTIKK